MLKFGQIFEMKKTYNRTRQKQELRKAMEHY